MILIAAKRENWDFFILCSINLNMASISGTGDIQPVFNLDPCVMKHLWCDIADSSINFSCKSAKSLTGFLETWSLIINKPLQEKIRWCYVL